MNSKLRDFPCPICGSTEYKVLYPDSLGSKLPQFGYDFTPDHILTYRIITCKKCSHGFCSPRPEDFAAHYVDVVDDPYLLHVEERLKTARWVVNHIRKFIPSGRMLDIGCSTGDFLTAAKDYFEVEGIELSNWAGKIARERGFTVHHTRIHELKPKALYDIITLWAVIEHFDDPNREIESVRKLLKPGGILCVWTGDLDSVSSKILGKKWWYVLGQHIQMFTHQSLRLLLEKNGFEKVWTGTYPMIVSMLKISQSLRRYPFISEGARKAISRIPIPDFTLKLPGEMFFIYKKV